MRFPRPRLAFPCSLAAGALALGVASTALAQSPPAGAAAAPAVTRPVVEVDGQRGYLEARPVPGPATEDDSWRFICDVPCRRTLDPSFEYRISGLSAVDSRPFHLPEGQTHVRVNADVGSIPVRVGGLVLTPVGGVALGLGLLTTLAASVLDNAEGTNLGVAVSAGGAVALGAGIAMIVGSRTKVTVNPVEGPALQLTKGVSLTARGLVF